MSTCVYSEPRLAEERPLAQLHIVGVVQYGKQAEVFFNDDGHILSAQVGQRIGKEGYLIEKVSKNSVAFGYKTGQCEQTTSIMAMGF